MNAPILAELAAFIQKRYLDHPNIVITPITKGEENQNFHIAAGRNAYVLRVYSSQHATTGLRKNADIEFELDFIDLLRSQGVPTPRVIRTLDDLRIDAIRIDHQTRYTVLFEFVAGEEAVSYNPQKARSVAETLLNIRKSRLGRPFGAIRKWPGNIVELSLKFYQDNRCALEAHQGVLDGLYHNAAAEYAHIQGWALPTGIIHGDIKLDNLLFDGNRVKAVLDFDDYRESYLLEELTRTVLHDLDSQTRNVIRSGTFPEFQGVFAADSSISKTEMNALSFFMQARFIYDITVYAIHGFNPLIEEIFADKNIIEVLLRGGTPW
jgi:Ser/Thr protein kinase RdoA (MazF antagonist)